MLAPTKKLEGPSFLRLLSNHGRAHDMRIVDVKRPDALLRQGM